MRGECTESMVDSTSFSLVSLVQSLHPTDDEIHHSRFDDPLDQHPHSLLPLRRVLVLFLPLRFQHFLVRHFLQHFDHRDGDFRVLVGQEVSERVERR